LLLRRLRPAIAGNGYKTNQNAGKDSTNGQPQRNSSTVCSVSQPALSSSRVDAKLNCEQRSACGASYGQE
jgi:hypothetical protein